jgi:ATP-dependent helicase/nuclease subunit B
LCQERFYGYIAFTRARSSLVVTWAQRNAEDVQVAPSVFIDVFKRLFPSLQAEVWATPASAAEVRHANEVRAEWIRWHRSGMARRDPDLDTTLGLTSAQAALFVEMARYAPSNALSPALAEVLYGRELRISISAMERFAACPFQFFVRHGLRAGERELFEADARERGGYQHQLLALFHEELHREKKRWRDVEPGEARARVRRIARQLTAEFRDGLFASRPEALVQAEAMGNLVGEFLEAACGWMRTYGLDPVAVELGFGNHEEDTLPPWKLDLGNGCTLAFQGRVDRVDVGPDPGTGVRPVVVVDYKSSAQSIDPLLLAHGIQLQLPAYLAALCGIAAAPARFSARRLEPAGAFYINLRGEVESAPNRAEVFTQSGKLQPGVFQHVGRFRADLLSLMDDFGNPSGQLKYRRTAKGKLHAGDSNPLSADEFQAMLQAVEARLKEFGNRILAGEAGVDPYRRRTSETPCSFCAARAVCRIDAWTHVYRTLKPLNASKGAKADDEALDG